MAKFVRPSNMGGPGPKMSDPPATNAGEDAAQAPEAEETSTEGSEGAESDEEPGQDAGGAAESDEDLDEGEEGEAPEPDEEPGNEEDDSDAGDDEEADSGAEPPGDEAAELRLRLAQVEGQLAQAGQLIQQLRAPQAPAAPKAPSDVEQALDVIYKLRLNPTDAALKKRFEEFPAQAQEDAFRAFRAADERLQAFARDPEGFLREHTRKAIEEARESDRQLGEEQAFVDQHLAELNDPAWVTRLNRKVAALVGRNGRPSLAVLKAAAADLKKEDALAKKSKREHKVAAKERDQRAVKRAQQDRGSRRADLGGQPGKKTSPFTGKETSIREIRRKAKEAGLE